MRFSGQPPYSLITKTFFISSHLNFWMYKFRTQAATISNPVRHSFAGLMNCNLMKGDTGQCAVKCVSKILNPLGERLIDNRVGEV